MISFLIKVTPEGDLVDIIWSDPAYLFLSSSDNLFQQISFDHWAVLEKDFDLASQSNTVIFSDVKYPFKISQVNVYLHTIQQKGSLMVLGYEVEEPVCQHSLSHQRLSSRFLEAMAKLDNHQALFSDGGKVNYYEKIQALNNDLINMQRQLHKANAQLNQLNKTLNNRLVKDPLTGLISRYQFEDEITRTIQESPKAYGVFAFIDLDDFKQVNDTYGHQIGDEYLKAFASRLTTIRIKDLLSIRIAGDEFGLYTHGYTLDEAYSIIGRINSDINQYVITEPVLVNTLSLMIKLSIGFAIYNHHSDNVYQLIDYADFAMYQSKKSGKGSFKIFDMIQYLEFKSDQPHE